MLILLMLQQYLIVQNRKHYQSINRLLKQKMPSEKQFWLSLPLKFLYKNPIGALITKDSLINDRDGCIQKAKNDPNLEKDPLLSQYVNSIPKAIRFKGVLLQGYLVYSKVLRRIENMEIRPDDIWVCTYPKSGTTWTEEILSLIYTEGDLEKASDKLISDRVPHLEVSKPFGHMKWLKSICSPRLLATHLNTNCIPAQLRENKGKIIYVVRNPKDNAVSYYHHHRMSTFLGNYAGTWEQFIQLFAKGQLVYGDWFEHVRGFWEMKKNNPESVLFVSYEELKVDLKSMISIISKFVGKSLTAERIDEIAKHCTFDKMRTNTSVNREKLPVPDLFDMSKCKFMRKGIIGDWRNHFSKEQSDHFDQLYNDRLESIGLKLVYDQEEAEHIMAHEGRIIANN